MLLFFSSLGVVVVVVVGETRARELTARREEYYRHRAELAEYLPFTQHARVAEWLE